MLVWLHNPDGYATRLASCVFWLSLVANRLMWAYLIGLGTMSHTLNFPNWGDSRCDRPSLIDSFAPDFIFYIHVVGTIHMW